MSQDATGGSRHAPGAAVLPPGRGIGLDMPASPEKVWRALNG